MSSPDTRLAEVLRLALVEGQSVRAISRGLSLSRRTVRRLLGRAADSRTQAAVQRTSLLNRFEPDLKRLLADTPEMRAPAMLERLRLAWLCWRDHHPARPSPWPAATKAARGVPHSRLPARRRRSG
jgi:hypothetical protein